MELTTTYGKTVYNDGTISKTMLFKFETKHAMVVYWNKRDKDSGVEWQMDIDALQISNQDFVEFGEEVIDITLGDIEEDRVSNEEVVRRLGRADKLEARWVQIQEQFDANEEYTNAVDTTIRMMHGSVYKTGKDFDNFRTCAMMLLKEFHI
jgi:hypothetical protein